MFTSTVPVNGNGDYVSDSYTPTLTGVYYWVASYSGDANNTAVTSPCNAPDESTDVDPASPTLTTAATPANTPVGQPIEDIATLANGFNPTGAITFELRTTDCSVVVFTSTVPVNGNGQYSSGTYIPTVPGTYDWTAFYPGDDNNLAAFSTCGAPGETAFVTTAAPSLTTSATASTTIGGSATDTATLAGGFDPTGTITFTLYGPGDATCAGPPVFTSTTPVAGNGDYTSGAFVPSASGTHRWVADYSGDTNNDPVSTACNDPGESTVVGLAVSTLATSATPTAALGDPISDTATLSGGSDPTGVITFMAFGPNNPTCTGAPVFTSTATVFNPGTFNSGPFTPAAAGTYRWIASYSGNATNAPVSTACNDPNEGRSSGWRPRR